MGNRLMKRAIVMLLTLAMLITSSGMAAFAESLPEGTADVKTEAAADQTSGSAAEGSTEEAAPAEKQAEQAEPAAEAVKEAAVPAEAAEPAAGDTSEGSATAEAAGTDDKQTESADGAEAATPEGETADAAAGDDAASSEADGDSPEKPEGTEAESAEEADGTEEAADEAGEEGAEEKTEEKAKEVTQTDKAGGATIAAKYMSDVFEEEVTLKVRELDSDSAEFARAEKSADKVTDKKNKAVYAFDIAFVNKEGKEIEPSKDVKISIRFNESPAEDSQKEFSLVHIDDKGKASVVEDSNINKDASKVEFENDQFSVYVVTAEQDGNVIVEGDAYYTTLAEALENASDGDTINIVGKTEDTGVVAVNKSVTIYSDGADGSLPNGLDPNAGTITLGGGRNTLTMGAVWATSSDTLVLNIEDGVHVTGGLPLYIGNENATLNIHGGKIEQTQERDSWNYAIGVWEGSINEITGGEIIALGEGGIYNATIGTISGGTIRSEGNGLHYCNVGTMSGGTINAGGYGMYLGWNEIGTISGGTVNAEDDAVYMYYGDTIDKISGGTFISENGAAIFTGGWAEGSTLNTISGGIFVGKNAAISGEATENEWIDISGGAFKSTSGGQAIDSNIKADFTNGAENVRWIETLDENSYKVPDGYAPSEDTVTVSGVDGNFHHFAKQIKVTYDGNGGKNGTQTSIQKTVTSPFKAAENEFVHPEEKAFKEWNTESDGLGTSYEEEASVTSDDDITLYAIWDDNDGPVSIGDVTYKNLQAAVAVAQDGDIIKVNANCVDSSDAITVDKNVTIIAGSSKVKSTNANLKVVDGKKLILGDGNADSILTMTGTVDVNEGSLEFNDGITLKNTITVLGESSTASVKGGKIAAKSFAIEVRDGATVSEISGGELRSTNAAALFIRKGVVKNISGENTSFTAANDSAVVVWQEGKIETIDNGRFISKKRNGYAAALYVEGTVDTINDGYFEGYLGLQISGEERDAVNPAKTQILGGEFYGKGGGRGNAINLGQIDSNNKRTYIVKNVKAVADTDFAIIVGHNNIVEEMSGVEASGAWGGLRLYNVSNKSITIGTISDSTFTYTGSDGYDFALEMGKDVHIDKIVNTTFDGGVGGGAKMGSWTGNVSTVGSIENCQFLGSKRGTGIENNASIGSITGTKITGRTALDNGYKDGKYGDVGTLGEGNEFTGVDYGIDSTGPIETISGGTYTGGEAGVHNGRITEQEWVQDDDGVWGSEDVDKGPSTIGTISGGTFSGAIGIVNEGSIDSINGPVEVTGTGGQAVHSTDKGSIGTIAGKGVYTGKDNAGLIDNEKTLLEPGITAVIGDGRYKSYSNTVNSLFESNMNLVLPNGYHLSETTKSVDGFEGEYHYLIKDNTVIYDGNGHMTESGSMTEVKTYETSSAKVEDNLFDTKLDGKNYKFTGWNTKNDGSGTAYKAGESIELSGKDIRLYAQWTELHTVTFDTDGGSPKPDDQQVADGDKANEPKKPEKTGYEFIGWFKTDGQDIADKVFDFDSSITEDTDLKAKWKINQYKVTYRYLGDVPSGASKLPDESQHDYGSQVTVAKDATAAGYTFSGWSRNDFTMPAEDVEITGSFTAKGDTPYKVEHYQEKLGGGYELKDTEDLTGKTDTETTANPKSYEGFSFNKDAEGTKQSGSIAGDGSLVLRLYYDRNKYTITFDSNGGSAVDPITQDYGSDVTAPADPTREGYTFDGWDTEIPSQMPANDMTIKAKWKINQYKVSFDSNGGSSVNDQTVDHGSNVKKPANPKRSGYKFKGWTLNGQPYDFSTPVTGPITLEAEWEKVQTKPQQTEEPEEEEPATVVTPDDTDDTPTPAPAGRNRNARPAAAAPAAPAVPAAEIEDEPVPQAEPQAEPEEIPEQEPPKAVEPEEGRWALLNLIAAILATAGAVVAMFRRKEDDDDDPDNDDDDDSKRKLTVAKVLGGAAAAASIIAFALTEDMSLPMAFVDKWTILMAALFAGQVASAVGAKKAAESETEDDENQE